MSPTVLSQSVPLREEASANGGPSTSASSSSSSTVAISKKHVAGSQNGDGRAGTPMSLASEQPEKSHKSSTNGQSKSTSKDTSNKSVANKRARSSPFRIKVGCVVAVRYRSCGNRVSLMSPKSNQTGNKPSTSEIVLPAPDRSSLAYFEVWADPQPGRDDGWALIGRRVRCCFPKSILSRDFQGGKKPTTRMLEGEIISIVDFPKQLQRNRRRRKRIRPFVDSENGSSIQKRLSYGTLVELLVDEDRLNALPFLKRVDPVVDLSKLSGSARRGYINEERIRGNGKVVVEVRLADASRIVAGANGREDIVARWVIRKRVPSNLPKPKIPTDGEKPKLTTTKKKEQFETKSEKKDAEEKTESNKPTGEYEPQGEGNGQKSGASEDVDKGVLKGAAAAESTPPKKRRKGNGANKDVSSAARYVGDGNDPSEQQEKNWRWLAARYNNMMLLEERPISIDYLEMLSYGLMVGEVTKVQPAPPSSSTLAFVTIKRLILPEHTKNGRLAEHNIMDMYDDYDSTWKSYCTSGGEVVKDTSSDMQDDSPVYYQYPVEELVIVNRRVKRTSCSNSSTISSASSIDNSGEPEIAFSYSLKEDSYFPVGSDNNLSNNEQLERNREDSRKRCHRCRAIVSKLSKVVGNIESPSTSALCKPCARSLKSLYTHRGKHEEPVTSICDCSGCEVSLRGSLQSAFVGTVSNAEFNTQQQRLLHAEEESESTKIGGGATSFLSTRSMLRSNVGRNVDFCLPPDFLTRSTPSSKPILKVKAKTPKKVKKSLAITTRGSPANGEKGGSSPKPSRATAKETVKEEQVKRKRVEELKFAPTSCRLIPYNARKRKFDASPLELYPWISAGRVGTDVTEGDKLRNLRLLKDDNDGEPEKEGKTMNSRAARANQRRLMRDVAAIGLSFDSLAGREQQLRFDRSGIHAWGVFADDGIREGEMIIEYRGEIIENAVAEKREIEYERAKIGSDYMFRIDDFIVCDATKQGNVARFINASCEPNCHTKIISIDGTKRIAIYAKRDIVAGEELCYDYKFPLEYDEAKRIPCLCRARDCRGYMNWDKKWKNRKPRSSSRDDLTATRPPTHSMNRFKHAPVDIAKEER